MDLETYRWRNPSSRSYPQCFLCKKMGLPGSEGETFNPKLLFLLLCKVHWKAWRTALFSFPVKNRRKILRRVSYRFKQLDSKDLKRGFTVFWDIIMTASQESNSKLVEDFIR